MKSTWKVLPLRSIVESTLGGDWGESPEEASDEMIRVRTIRGTEFASWEQEKGSSGAMRAIKPSSLDKRRLVAGDLLIEVSGGGPKQPVGRCLMIDEEAITQSDLPLSFSNFVRRIRLTSNVEPKYASLFLRLIHASGLTEQHQTQTTNLRNLNVNGFLDGVKVPVPPLTEQRRMVARIEALTSRLEQARALRHQTVQRAETFLRAIVASDKKAKPTRMRNLVRLRSADVAVRSDEIYHFAGVYSFGRGVFKSVVKSGNDFAYSRLTRVKAGEFVYPKLMAWEGALGIVPPECDGCVVSTEFPVFDVNSDRVFPEVLDVYFRTPSVWPELAGLSAGTNVRRRRLNPQAFLDYEMALPSRETQVTLRGAWAKQTELRRLQTETETELTAFTPALLAKAFRGEL